MSNVPKLRFGEFNGEWEEKGFEDVLRAVPTKSYQVKSSKVLEKGMHKVVDQGRKLIAGYSNEQNKLYNGGEVIVFGDHTTIIKYIDFNCIVGADGTKLLKTTKENSLRCIYNSLIHNNVKQEGYKRHFSILKNIKFNLPTKPEQEKIASFLTAVDKKIELLTKKESLLQEYKKGVMQKIFSQEIRFKDDDGSEFGEWEEKKLGDVIIENKKSNIQVNHVSNDTEKDKLNKYPFFTSGQKVYFTNNFILDGNNIFLSTGGVANVIFSDRKCSYSTDTYSVSSKKENVKFLYYLIAENLRFIQRTLFTGSGLKHLDKKGFKAMKVNLPCLKEQNKIANFLSTIDKKIEVTKKQLEKTKTYKKALLQQMFV